jgi:hypothetical protein
MNFVKKFQECTTFMYKNIKNQIDKNGNII